MVGPPLELSGRAAVIRAVFNVRFGTEDRLPAASRKLALVLPEPRPFMTSSEGRYLRCYRMHGMTGGAVIAMRVRGGGGDWSRRWLS
jgi:hypothetical protein